MAIGDTYLIARGTNNFSIPAGRKFIARADSWLGSFYMGSNNAYVSEGEIVVVHSGITIGNWGDSHSRIFLYEIPVGDSDQPGFLEATRFTQSYRAPNDGIYRMIMGITLSPSRALQQSPTRLVLSPNQNVTLGTSDRAVGYVTTMHLPTPLTSL